MATISFGFDPSKFSPMLASPAYGAGLGGGSAAPMGAFPWGKFLPAAAGGLAGLGALLAPNAEQSIGRRFKALEGLAGPVSLTNRIQQLYNLFSQSPANALAQRNILSGSNVLRQGLQRSLGARGLSTSGIGAVAIPMAESSAAFGMANLQSETWGKAADVGLQSLMAQLQLAAGADRDKQYELLGALLGALGPMGRSFLGGGQ